MLLVSTRCLAFLMKIHFIWARFASPRGEGWKPRKEDSNEQTQGLFH